MNKRRSIILPPGTTIQGTASNTGLQVYEDQIMGLAVDNMNPVLVDVIAQFGNTSNPALVQVTCPNNASAINFLSQIQNYLASDGFGSPFTPIVAPAPGLTWVSVAPSTATVAAGSGSFAITGTGFQLTPFFGYFKVDDGSGDTNTLAMAVNSDTSITMTGGFDSWFPAPGNYTVYYTLDGSTFTTTGLTITVS